MSPSPPQTPSHPGWLLIMDTGDAIEWHRHDPRRHSTAAGTSALDALWAAIVPNKTLRKRRRASGWSIKPGPGTALYPSTAAVPASA